MTVTRFMDMHSGGGRKLDWEIIFIEAPKEEARTIFYNRFGRNPDRVTCTCCGNDYSYEDYDDIAQASGWDRDCANEGGKYVEKECPDHKWHGGYKTVDEYLKNGNGDGVPLFIRADEIKPQERGGNVPEEGDIWA